MGASRGARGLRRLSSSSLARNAGWMLLAQIGRVVCQAGYFVLIARGLGAHGFGAFAAALALVSLLAPFAALGSGDLLTMHVARDPQSFRSEWGNALAAIAVVAAPLSAIALGAAAMYAAAYRATTFAFLPIVSLLNAAYPRFFRAGEGGIEGSRRFARRLARPAIVYSLLASATLFLAAPLVPHVLGADYAGSVGALRWLAVLPLVQTAYYLPADALTGAGYQRLRSSLQVGAALLNVLLNLWLVPRYSLVGAAVATLVALGALALSLWIVVEIAMRRSSAGKE